MSPRFSFATLAAVALWLVLAAVKNVHLTILAVKVVRWLTGSSA